MPVRVVNQTRPAWRPPSTADWRVEKLTGPNRVVIHDRNGVLATLTEGARTANYRNKMRIFTEQKEAFNDAFDRDVNNGFGSSPGGGNWTNANGPDSDYSVARSTGGRGAIRMSTINSSRYVTILDNLDQVDARLAFTTSAAATGDFISVSLVFCYDNSGDGIQNHNRAKLTFNVGGTVLAQLTKRIDGVETSMSSAVQIATGYTAGQEFNIRATTDGAGHHSMYAWKTGTTEPTTPTCTATDTNNVQGRVGGRAIVGDTWSGGTTTFAYFHTMTVAATWPAPPVVTHDRWVRLLPAPFTGWSRRTANILRRWTRNTSPDILGTAMGYVSGGAVILDPALGEWHTGAAGYGPLDEFGKRIEGADWNDYNGTDYTYPIGADPIDPAEPAELHCLDCSGLVRRVFGYHFGIPLVRNDPTTFDGLAIPRRTVDIAPYGPGIILAQAVGAPPSLTGLLEGDVIFHDADPTDPIEGTIDHDGIVLGTDRFGVVRFISSRKTINGPTFSDLGGRSAVNGTGNYPNRLRVIRRF